MSCNPSNADFRPANYNIQIWQNNTWSQIFQLTANTDPIDLTGANIEIQVRRRPNSADADMTLTLADGITIGGVDDNQITINYDVNIDAGSYVLNTRSGNKERISRIFQMHANKQNQIPELCAGDIAAVVGFKDIKTGDTLCAENAPIILESMDFPDPVIGLAIEPKTQADTDKLSIGLNKLSEEDPTFRVNTDEETGQTIISGMGELHLEIIVDRLRREFKVEVNQGAPQVAYRENINGSVEHRETYKKQSGGRGKFADILIRISPQENIEKTGLEFINSIKGGNIPREFIPSVEKGFRESMKNGVLAGFPL